VAPPIRTQIRGNLGPRRRRYRGRDSFKVDQRFLQNLFALVAISADPWCTTDAAILNLPLHTSTIQFAVGSTGWTEVAVIFPFEWLFRVDRLAGYELQPIHLRVSMDDQTFNVLLQSS
jgi:hypothetical protein